jgi:hypothetical protein
MLYRLTLKPLEILNEDIDRVLKGDLAEVSRNFKFDELNQLFDVINSALQRIPMTAGESGNARSMEPKGISIQDFVEGMRSFVDSAQYPVAICDSDKKVVYINLPFEDVTGIRSIDIMGQDLSGSSRDQAFGAMALDLFNQASQRIGETLEESFDFSGVSYKVKLLALGELTPKSYILTLNRKEEDVI